MGLLTMLANRRSRRLAAAMPAWDGTAQRGHVVQFYGGAFPAATVGRFVQEGLAAGEVAIVIATPQHIQAVQGHLAGMGRSIFLDAQEAMDGFMVDGAPDRTRFFDTVGDLVAQAAQLGNGSVRAFGEMVVLLCRDGKPEAARQLEELWNELCRRHDLKLLCSYPLSALGGRNRNAAAGLCDAHSHAVMA